MSGRRNGPETDPAGAQRPLLDLYRRVGTVLEAFFARWTAPFCRHCLVVTRHGHADDPRAQVDLVEGVFPGCCQAGVADALWVSTPAGRVPVPDPLLAPLRAARSGGRPDGGAAYAVRERATGAVHRGRGCAQLGTEGCRLGPLKAPLCLTYLCDAARAALAAALPGAVLGCGSDDFCGARGVLAAVLRGDPGAERAVTALESYLRDLDRRLAARVGGAEDGLLRAWLDGRGRRRGAGEGTTDG